jgi:hypothetical protein
MQNKLGCAETEYELAVLAQLTDQKEASHAWFSKALEHYSDIGNGEKTASIKKILLQEQSEQTQLIAESLHHRQPDEKHRTPKN